MRRSTVPDTNHDPERRIDRTNEGDATIGAETIRLGNRDAVACEIREDPTIGVGSATDFRPFASLLFGVYAFVLNLLLGAALLVLFPAFSASVADRVATDPVRTGLVGLGLGALATSLWAHRRRTRTATAPSTGDEPTAE